MSEQTPIDLIKFLASDDYSFIFRAPLKQEDIFATFDARSIIETNEATEGLIEGSWEKECAMALKEDRVHFDTLGYSLIAWSFDTFRKKLNLNFGATSYKEFFGTFKSHPEIFKKFGRTFVSYPLAVFSLIETSDGKLVFARRGNKVSGARGVIAPIGGFLDRKDELDGRHLFYELGREMREELGIPEQAIENMTFVAIVQKNELGGLPRLAFRSKLKITAAETKDLFVDHHDFEHTEVIFVDPNEAAIKNFLTKEGKNIYWNTKACLRIFLSF